MLGFVRPLGLSTDAFKVYRAYYCGLCWQLRRDYGPLARLLTSYEATLLALLIDTQAGNTVVWDESRCPAHPFRANRHMESGGLSLQAAARLTLLMFELKLRDDIQDKEFGRRPLYRRYEKLFVSARRWLVDNGFPLESVQNEFDELRQRETALPSDEEEPNPVARLERYAQTTAAGLATSLAYTADLAGTPENREALAIIGRDLGTLIYALDNIIDFRKDVAKRRFNPFISDQVGATPVSIKDLVAEVRPGLDVLFNYAISTIRRHTVTLRFGSYEETVKEILSDGIPRTLRAYYNFAQEGLFDESRWKRLLLYSRAAAKRNA